jgi:hypothetical protein
MVTLLRLHKTPSTPIDVNLDLVKYIIRYNGTAQSGSALVFNEGDNVHVVESMDTIYQMSGNLLVNHPILHSVTTTTTSTRKSRPRSRTRTRRRA